MQNYFWGLVVACLCAGARGEAEAPGSDQAALGGQPEAPGGVAELCCQAEEVHRVGLQHHRLELRAPPEQLLRPPASPGTNTSTSQQSNPCSVERSRSQSEHSTGTTSLSSDQTSHHEFLFTEPVCRDERLSRITVTLLRRSRKKRDKYFFLFLLERDCGACEIPLGHCAVWSRCVFVSPL